MKIAAARRVVIALTPTLVTFSDMDGDRVGLVPVIYVDPAAARIKVLGVGEPAPAGRNATRLDVFGPEPASAARLSRFEVLVVFFRGGLSRIVRRSLLPLRPAISVRYEGWPPDALGSIDRDVIAAALQRAGARTVRWSDER
jgi:hypothetical protein